MARAGYCKHDNPYGYCQLCRIEEENLEREKQATESFIRHIVKDELNKQTNSEPKQRYTYIVYYNAEDNEWVAYTAELRRSAVGVGDSPINAIIDMHILMTDLTDEEKEADNVGHYVNAMMDSAWHIGAK